MELKYVLFDMDGMLVNSRESIYEANEYTLSQYGKHLREEDKSRIIGPPLYLIYTEIFGFDHDTAVEAIETYRSYYGEHCLQKCRLFDGVEEMLQELTAHGKKLMVATARLTNICEEILETLGIRHYFCFVGGTNAYPGSEMPGAITNKAEVIDYVLKENGIFDKECAVMVGDRAEDILGGKANDIKTIGVLHGFGSEEELAGADADHLCADPLSVSRYIIENYE